MSPSEITSFAAFGSSPAEAARNVLARHWDGQLPINLERMCASLGVDLSPRGGFSDAGYPYSGFFKRENGRAIVEFNQTESHARQRFTIAHELGHFALGHPNAPRGDLPANFGSAVGDPRERAANQFAAELLMPAAAVRTLVESGRFSGVGELAAVFDVSKVAMSYRMSNLGLGT